MVIEPFKRQPHKIVKHTQRIRRLLLTNCLNVFDHFVGLALNGLTNFLHIINKQTQPLSLVLLFQKKLYHFWTQKFI